MKKLAIVFSVFMLVLLSPLIAVGFIARVLAHGLYFGWFLGAKMFNFFWMISKLKNKIGIKNDADKPRPSLVIGSFARALLAVSEVATYGAKKYSDDGWAGVENAIKRYTDAKDRHRLMGAIYPIDDESELLHAAHEAWNALAVLELLLRAKGD